MWRLLTETFLVHCPIAAAHNQLKKLFVLPFVPSICGNNLCVCQGPIIFKNVLTDYIA